MTRLDSHIIHELVNLHDARVLVADDNEDTRLVIRAFLDAAGVGHIDFADGGEECLKELESFHPDLILLDLMMPDMDGFEVLKRMRADDRFEWMPVIVETALDTASNRAKAFAAGATDLINKPINGPELIGRVRTHLENSLLKRKLQESQKQGYEGVLLAQKLQESLLPNQARVTAIQSRYGLELDCYFEPSEDVGGDLWGVHFLNEKKLGIFNVDFSGHGVSAALNSFRFHALMGETPPSEDNPAGYLARLNNLLLPNINRGEFATMLYGIVDRGAGVFTYASAGATRPLLGCGKGLDLTLLDTSGVPLGIVPEASYTNRQASFPSGASLLFYSDALIESEDLEGCWLGENGLSELLREVAETAEGIPPLDALIGSFFERQAWAPLTDDLTVVWLHNP